MWDEIIKGLAERPDIAGLVLLVIGQAAAVITLWRDNAAKSKAVAAIQEKRVDDRDPFVELARDIVQAMSNNTTAMGDLAKALASLQAIVMVSLDHDKPRARR